MFQAARLAAEKEAGEGAAAAVEAWLVTFVMRLREGGATRVKLLSSSRSCASMRLIAAQRASSVFSRGVSRMIW